MSNPLDANGVALRLRDIVTEFDNEVADMMSNDGGERADLWVDVDVPIGIVRQAASALTAQAAALVDANARGQALWDRPDMRDPAPDKSIDTWLRTIPYRGQWVVPGVLSRLVERARAEGAEAAEKRIAELEAGLAFYASKANYADVPLQQWFRENEGKDAPTGYRCGNIDISAKPGHAIAPIFADLGDLARRLTHQEKNNG